MKISNTRKLHKRKIEFVKVIYFKVSNLILDVIQINRN